MHAQAMADQPRWRGIEYASQNEAARRCDRDDLLFIVGGAPLWQLAEMRPLQIDATAVVGILSADDLIDEATIGNEIVEVSGATQQQRILQRPFQMAMRAFDGTVLVRDARV